MGQKISRTKVGILKNLDTERFFCKKNQSLLLYFKKIWRACLLDSLVRGVQVVFYERRTGN